MTLGLLCVVLAMSAQRTDKLSVDKDVRVGHLDNGLTYYIRHNEQPKQRAEFHIAQAVGAVLEEDNQNGLAHFLEHMAFNGTKHFAGKGIINYFESIGVNFGGNINAYTSIDETVYRLSDVPTVREGIIDSALLVMYDWSCGLLLEPDEIDAERGVIREEWRTRATPGRLLYKDIIAKKYPGTQYGKRDVIGDTAVINNFAYDALRDYYHKWYGPDLQAIIVVGDIDVDQIEQKIKDLWKDVPARPNRGERPLHTVPFNDRARVVTASNKEAQSTDINIEWLHEQGIVMVEQPMKKTKHDDIAWITERSPLPIMADESLQRLVDIPKMKGVFSGINIKLMKCTGLREAWKMLNLARALDMKVMVGCMTETSCAISAAAQLSPAVDWADLDGNLLISNDLFDGIQTAPNGKLILSDKPGLGLTKLEKPINRLDTII